MKKTLIALLALGGMAMADTAQDLLSTTYTMDFGYISNSTGGLEGSTVVDTLANDGTYVTFDKLANTPTITLQLDHLYTAVDIPTLQEGQKLVLTSIQVVSRPDINNRPVDATVTLGGELGTSAAADYSALSGSTRGLITFNFTQPVDITNLNELALTFNTSAAKGFGYSCVYSPKSGYSLIGATPAHTNGGTSYYMPLRLNTKIVPEPATATLSLLALAGLAARRKRH